MTTGYEPSNNFNLDLGDAATGFPVSVPALSQAVLLGDTHNFSQHVVNEIRVGFNRLNVTFATNTIGTVPSDVGVDQAITRATFTDTSLAPFGLNGVFPEGRIVNTWQAQDNFNWVIGKHTFKSGVNYTYQRSPNTFLPNLNGAFRFANWEAFAANTPNRVRIAAGSPTLDFREHDTFLYAGDDAFVFDRIHHSPLCIYPYLRICHDNACPASEYAPYEAATGSTG